jgi:hypothetical protein
LPAFPARIARAALFPDPHLLHGAVGALAAMAFGLGLGLLLLLCRLFVAGFAVFRQQLFLLLGHVENLPACADGLPIMAGHV